MYGVISSATPLAAPASRDPDRRFRPALAGVDRRAGPAAAAICPHRVARWACGEGLGAGTTVALLVADLGQAEAIRLGLARIGTHVTVLDGTRPGQPLADSLVRSDAALVIVDTALSDAYASVMGRLATYPAVWWNGPGADFASLDLALDEQA